MVSLCEILNRRRDDHHGFAPWLRKIAALMTIHPNETRQQPAIEAKYPVGLARSARRSKTPIPEAIRPTRMFMEAKRYRSPLIFMKKEAAKIILCNIDRFSECF